jgi:hypothetical protein
MLGILIGSPASRRNQAKSARVYSRLSSDSGYEYIRVFNYCAHYPPGVPKQNVMWTESSGVPFPCQRMLIFTH